MIDITGIHRPLKMVKKIHQTFRRNWVLTYSSSGQRKLRTDLVTSEIEDSLYAIANHLWYEHCGLTREELKALVHQEWESVKMLELLDV